MLSSRALSLLWLFACLCVGCGGNSVAPSAATPTPGTSAPSPTPGPAAPSVTPTNLEVSVVSYRTRTVRLNWAPSPGATSYRISLGRGAGGNELGLFESPVPSFELNDLPVSNSPGQGALEALHVCVAVGTIRLVGSNCAFRVLVLPDFRDVVDALFFSRGPFSDLGAGAAGSTSPLPARTSWRAAGVPYGGPMRILLSTSVSAGHRADVRRAVQHISDLFPGLYRLSVDEPENSLDDLVRNRRILAGEIIVAEFSPSEITSMCGGIAIACAPFQPANLREGFSNIAIGSDVLSKTVHHEMGHALLGLAHMATALPPPILNERFRWWELPTMHPRAWPQAPSTGTLPARAFAELEAEAFAAVAAAGLRPNDFRERFVAAGLVR